MAHTAATTITAPRTMSATPRVEEICSVIDKSVRYFESWHRSPKDAVYVAYADVENEAQGDTSLSVLNRLEVTLDDPSSSTSS